MNRRYPEAFEEVSAALPSGSPGDTVTVLETRQLKDGVEQITFEVENTGDNALDSFAVEYQPHRNAGWYGSGETLTALQSLASGAKEMASFSIPPVRAVRFRANSDSGTTLSVRGRVF